MPDSTSHGPRAVFAMPVYNEEKHLRETLDSLLGQTEPDLRVVILDNCSTDATGRIAEGYAQADRRVTYERNEAYVGVVDNYRRAFFRALSLHPSATYFAWWGGHDTPDPRWLEVLAAALDGNPALVGVYPTGLSVRTNGTPTREMRTPGDTVGMHRPRDRLKVPLRGMVAQGLLRPEPVRQAGVSRRVPLPDMLFLAELSARGEILHVPETLWARRMNPKMTKGQILRRQRAAIFPYGTPLYARLPWLLLHGGTLFWSLAIGGSARPQVGRLEGVAVAATYVRVHLWRRARSVTTKKRIKISCVYKVSRRWVRRVPPRLFSWVDKHLRRRPAKSLDRTRKRLVRRWRHVRMSIGRLLGRGVDHDPHQ